MRQGEQIPVVNVGTNTSVETGKQGMFQVVKEKTRLPGRLLWLLLSLSPVVAVHAGDDYLAILEAEAADTGVSSNSVAVSETPNSKHNRFSNLRADRLIETGLSFKAFEETLSTRYSGSNFLYVKLSESDRQGVYRFYQRDNRISSIREEIVRLLSSG